MFSGVSLSLYAFLAGLLDSETCHNVINSAVRELGVVFCRRNIHLKWAVVQISSVRTNGLSSFGQILGRTFTRNLLSKGSCGREHPSRQARDDCNWARG